MFLWNKSLKNEYIYYLIVNYFCLNQVIYELIIYEIYDIL